MQQWIATNLLSSSRVSVAKSEHGTSLMGVRNILENSRRNLASVNSFTKNYKDRQSFVSILKELTYMKKVLFTCIGTDRVTGDCLGPLVGTNLEWLGYAVLGTIDEPLHALNLVQELEKVLTIYEPDLVLAIDAGLGRSEDIGTITLANFPLRPGIGVHKHLPPVGDISIMGIVNTGDFSAFQILQCTRLNTVMRIAADITNLIWQAVPIFHRDLLFGGQY